MRYLLYIKFVGTNYHGWQVQQNALAVQPVVQDGLYKLIGERPALSGCSRTDSGVHANMYCCHFDSDKALDKNSLTVGLNMHLPDDIACYDAKPVSEDFHARYSCKEKEYIYVIHNSRCRDPFSVGQAYHYSGKLDEDLLNQAAEQFVGTYDFSAFCAANAKEGDKTRTVNRAFVTRIGDKIIFSVRADGFLYNMVRIMAGTLLRVGQGKIRPEDIKGIIESKDRSKAGPTAPACGLFLQRVEY